MLNPNNGISAFVDNLIVISAARYGAAISDEPSAERTDKWELVALAVQSVLRHPHSDEERLTLSHVDVSRFSAAVCHHRAAYLLWKAKRAAESGPQRPSGFNITRDSLSNEIGLLYANVKQNLPTISGAADDSALEEIHAFACKSEEDVRRDQKLAEAEDDFMRSVQELQSEFYAKHKKWIDVPINLSPSKTDASKALQSSNGTAAAANGQAKPLEELDVAGVAQLLAQLDLAEHKDLFRRTTGRLLSEISKGDLRERFGSDKEAADILWAYIEKNKISGKEVGASSPPEKTPSRPQEKSTEREQVEKLFAAFRSPDPFSSLKRAMNPDRPLRPSEVQGQPDFALDDDAIREMDEKYARATAALASSSSSSSKQAPAPTTKQAPSSSKPVPAAKITTAESTAPSRGNRWQVVEYDDDDDDEDD